MSASDRVDGTVLSFAEQSFTQQPDVTHPRGNEDLGGDADPRPDAQDSGKEPDTGDHRRSRPLEHTSTEPETPGCSNAEVNTRLTSALDGADRRDLVQLFRLLPPPALDSLCGEYESRLLDQGSRAGNALTSRVFRMHGRWLGKAFQPINQTRGIGYNYFESGGTIVQGLPMDTMIGESVLSQGPSLQIRYGAKNRGLIRWLIGEVRQVAPNLMLGIGLFGPLVGQRDRYRRKIPFVLRGPVGVYNMNQQHQVVQGRVRRSMVMVKRRRVES